MGQALGCIQVDQSTVAIKENFGKFNDVLEPGCHCVPWGVGSQLGGYLSLRVQHLDIKCETKTKVSLHERPFFFCVNSLSQSISLSFQIKFVTVMRVGV